MEIEAIRTGLLLLFLAVCSYWDICFYSLPLWLLFGGAAAGVVLGLIQNRIGAEFIVSIVPGVCLRLLAWLFPKQIGEGDGWVVIAAGALKGGGEAVLLLETGFLFMVPVALFWIVGKHKKNKTLPFAPFLFCGELCLLTLRTVG